MYPPSCFCKSIQTISYEVVSGSYIPTTQAKQERKSKEKSSAELENLGAFQKLPMVMPSADILYSALKKARRITGNKGIANIAKRERNRGARQLDALMKELAVPLRTYLEEFPRKKYLHPYERSLIELTLGDGNYEEVLGRVNALRKKVVSVGKEQASLCSKSSSKREAEERLSEGMKKVEEIFYHEGKAVDDLLHIAQTLRAMPEVNLETSTLCLVGAPNVGKSSLVSELSTGKPEICNYPFTTRGILMGHLVSSYQHFQVTDTPGLLKRYDEDRNNLEKLTLAGRKGFVELILDWDSILLLKLKLALINDLIQAIHVHEPTLEWNCDTIHWKHSILFQYFMNMKFVIYKEIKERFCDHLWLDVVSKCDLLQESPVVYITDVDDDDLELEKYRKWGPDGAIHVSVKSKIGLDKLKDRVHELLRIQMARMQSQTALT
ncbi:hypothetical protein FNV43_RR10500 [Rhamnella rubrinervis]|uniref:Nucleolar GTP-binding protein 1 n=1 Tax=Rhamnella rubrinervis TaxID=2594499 RepID=A0A8K0MGD1_9ROSA|nr:hypothetical protein FNV43_RR10500 [Rhamnella rubrinervis]